MLFLSNSAGSIPALVLFVILLLAGWLCALCLGRLWLAGTWLIILHILSYPRMLRPDCSARLAALQLLQSVPCDLWTNRSHRRGAGLSLGITLRLKTHTGHHIAHNNKNLNNRQKSSSISCSAEQISRMPLYFLMAFICKLDFIFQRSKPILNQIFAFSLQVFVFLEVLRTISDSICYSDDIRGFAGAKTVPWLVAGAEGPTYQDNNEDIILRLWRQTRANYSNNISITMDYEGWRW